MKAHPYDVVTFFVQDTVSPADTAEMFGEARLLRYVYTPPAGADAHQTSPTLRQMIESGQRLVVLMENHGGGATFPRLLEGFDLVQDTPFDFSRPSQFTWGPNRGPAERGRLPRAVDYYDRGDLFGVVDTVNGLG